MAHPKWHTLPTLVLAGLCLFATMPLVLMSMEAVVAGLVIFLGVFIDIDHVSVRRIKKILRKDKGPVSGWVNWAHTWQFALAVALISVFVWSALPFVSYAVHMLVDGGNRSGVTLSKGNSPLSDFLHRFYPRWLTYETGFII